jgi:hypothetical protein
MTREDIIRMAREAGDWNGQTAEFNDVGLQFFANLVAAHEREECAKVADAWQSAIHDPRYECDCADAIRARGEK